MSLFYLFCHLKNVLSRNFKKHNFSIILSRQQPFFVKCDRTVKFRPLAWPQSHLKRWNIFSVGISVWWAAYGIRPLCKLRNLKTNSHWQSAIITFSPYTKKEEKNKKFLWIKRLTEKILKNVVADYYDVLGLTGKGLLSTFKTAWLKKAICNRFIRFRCFSNITLSPECLPPLGTLFWATLSNEIWKISKYFNVFVSPTLWLKKTHSSFQCLPA